MAPEYHKEKSSMKSQGHKFLNMGWRSWNGMGFARNGSSMLLVSYKYTCMDSALELIRNCKNTNYKKINIIFKKKW